MEDSLRKESKKKFRFKERFKKIIKSRLVVLASLFVLISTAFVGVNRASADNNYDLSMTYQYFLLSNKNGYSGSDDTALKSNLGFLGSGGNQGTFNYNEIVDGAGKNNQYEAKKFSSMMATLSGYHYIATRTQSIQSSIGSGLEHFFVGLILIIFGFIADLASSIWSTLITVIADYNIFGILGSAFGGSPAGQKLASALGISTDDIKNIASLGLGLAVTILVGTIVWALRRGGTDPDRGALQKARNRALCIIGMPAVICACAMILSNVAPDIAGQNKTPVFAKYLINVKDWALKDNFDLGVAGMSSIRAGNADGTYIDTDYNPYGGGKAANIGDSLYKQNESSGAFPNTTLAMEYFRNSTFNASDYLSEIESAPKSQTNSIDYALSQWASHDLNPPYGIWDFSTEADIPYSSYGTNEVSWAKDKKSLMGSNPMNKAKDDYIVGSKQLAGIKQVWIDRYIYGAKNTGNIKDYYKAGPSLEQIYSGAGGTLTNGNGLRLSDESTFLALNTSFTPTGGTFSISGPAFGAYADIAKFDSVNPLYSDVSMVGTPIFTLPKMLSEIFIMILISLAILTAFWQMGIIEMNLLPFRAWLKGIFLGDLEYAEAAIIYALGIAGTIVILCVVPPILNTGLYAIVSAIFTPLTGNLQMNQNGTPTVNGTEMIGIAGWGVFLVAGFSIFAFFKFPKFRNGLIELLTIPWTWAKDKGQKLEDMAAGGSGSLKEVLKKNHNMRVKKNAEHNEKLKDLARGDSRQAQKLNKWTGGLSSAAARSVLGAKQKVGDYHPDDEDGTLSPKDALARDLEQSRIASELGNDMAKMKPKELDKNVDKALEKEKEDLENKPFEPDKDGMLNVADPRLTPEEAAEAEEINKEQQALDDEQAQIDADREALERAHDNGEISDEEYEKGLQDLAARQAEHDAKQAALDGKRDALVDGVNGNPVKLTKDGKIDSENPNLTPEQKGEAKKLNAEQDALNAEQKAIDTDRDALEKQHENGEISDEEYEQGLSDLARRQADHDAKQDALDMDKNGFLDKVNGTASLDKDGKFDLDNSNFTPEQRQEAEKLNAEQDALNAEKTKLDDQKAQLKKDLKDGKIDQAAFDKGMKEVEKEEQDLNNRQEKLDSGKSELQKAVAKANAKDGRAVTVADLKSQSATAKALAEETRGAIKTYQKSPSPQTAKAVVEKLNSMEQQAKAMGTTTKELYGFDAKARAQEIAHSKFMPEQMNGNAFTIEDNPDGTQTIITNGMNRGSGNGNLGGTSAGTVNTLRHKQPTLSGTTYRTGLAKQNQSAPRSGSPTRQSTTGTTSPTRTSKPKATLSGRPTTHLSRTSGRTSSLSSRNRPPRHLGKH